MIINDYESVSTPGQRSRYGVMQTTFYARQREETLKELSNFLGYCIQESVLNAVISLKCSEC